MTFSNFALMYIRILITGWFTISKMFVRCAEEALNHFSWINVVPCGVVDVNVSFDTWIASQRQMCGWLFLWQNVRVVNFSITHDYLVPSISFNVSMSSGNSNSNLASVTSNFSALVYASLKVPLHKVWNSFKTWYCEWVLLINVYIITRNYWLDKTKLILVVTFLLSVSIKWLHEQCL